MGHIIAATLLKSDATTPKLLGWLNSNLGTKLLATVWSISEPFGDEQFMD